jgi:hypothetical protein
LGHCSKLTKPPVVPPGFAAQNNNQREAVLKSFLQKTKNFAVETKNQILAQGVSIKNLENQVGQIATALSSRPSGALHSTTKIIASTLSDKGKETCKVISLRSGRECEGTSMITIITEAVNEDSAEQVSVTGNSELSTATNPDKSNPTYPQSSEADKTLVDNEVIKPC